MSITIKEYWDTRAASHARSPAATTSDIHLRELEARTLSRWLYSLQIRTGSHVLDAGCGDGHTTLRLAETCPSLRFTGVDYAPAMIAAASQRLSGRSDLAERVRFIAGDVLQLADIRPGLFDAALTVRCLINLPDADAQRAAFAHIAACLRPGATYLAIENFHEGHDEMNRARENVGLPAIPIRWHNRYFTEPEFCDMTGEHFVVTRFVDFASAYYFATRVIYSRMCQMRGEEPDYDDVIHRLAIDLPECGRFSPVRLAILTRR
jgi:SAM-dependent methyltransferase